MFHMEQLKLFDDTQYSEQVELFNDIEYLEWLEEMHNQSIEHQEHELYWKEQDNKTS